MRGSVGVAVHIRTSRAWCLLHRSRHLSGKALWVSDSSDVYSNKLNKLHIMYLYIHAVFLMYILHIYIDEILMSVYILKYEIMTVGWVKELSV